MRRPGRYTYYFRDPDTNAPLITVILLDMGENTYRGVSVCSDRDNPCKKDGRKYAADRAITAMFSNERETCPIVRFEPEDTVWTLMNLGERFYYKSERNPELTEFEKHLLRDKEVE